MKRNLEIVGDNEHIRMGNIIKWNESNPGHVICVNEINAVIVLVQSVC